MVTDMAGYNLRMNSIDEDRDRRMRDEGREEGRIEERMILMPALINTVRALMEYHGWTVEEALARLEMPDDVRDDVISALG